MKNLIKAALTLGIFILSMLVLDSRIGTMPSIMRMLNPSRGLWANARTPQSVAREDKMRVPGLKNEVVVAFDSLHVPHIYAKSLRDLYFAQGFITAGYRLWQMEFQTHAAAGRLSEIVGSKALEYDRFQRQIGMAWAAERSAEVMLNNPVTQEILEAYTDGINAQINRLTYRDIPAEYKALHYSPEPWTPVKTALLLKSMAFTLSFYNDDARMTRTLAHLGPAATDSLFPNFPHWADPIIPPGTRFDSALMPVPPVPGQITVPDLQHLLAWSPSRAQLDQHQGLGSNNWAVAGSKTLSGHAILANDPHLTLSLPSLWFLVGLHAPGIDVMGASLPGAPGVIIGANDAIAWGVTNTGSDVTDWYKMKFNGEHRQRYFYNGNWHTTRFRDEVIMVRQEQPVHERVPYTLHGPVVNGKPGGKNFNKDAVSGYALRWMAHDPANELLTFFNINKARNWTEFKDALRNYGSPAQNFAYADVYGNVAMAVNGRFPVKWKGQGKYLLDGTRRDHAWLQTIAPENVPVVVNPPRRYVSSANQHSTDSTYPYYLNYRFSANERGHRINQVLEKASRLTVNQVKRLQNDNIDARAQLLLPQLMKSLPTMVSARVGAAKQLLTQWDYAFETSSKAATLWHLLRENMQEETWADELPGDSLARPNIDTWQHLALTKPASHWFDDRRTPQREQLGQILVRAMEKALDSLKVTGPSLTGLPAWGEFRQVDVMHLARIAAFSSQGLVLPGSKNAVNAMGPNHGPSLRFVKELNGKPGFWAAYPGGQSGNPFSPRYRNLLTQWQRGELVFIEKVDETNASYMFRMRP